MSHITDFWTTFLSRAKVILNSSKLSSPPMKEQKHYITGFYQYSSNDFGIIQEQSESFITNRPCFSYITK